MAIRVLHITPWYPTSANPYFAIWIKRHIQALEMHCENDVLHFSIDRGPFGFERKRENNLRTFIFSIGYMPWRVMEWAHQLLLIYFLLFRYNLKGYTHINFHIAYPNLIGFHRIRKWIPCKVLVTEHWSYYHYHFHSTKKLTRVKSIFKQDYPLICVSKTLQNDISNFANHDVKAHIVPNSINTSVFDFKNHDRNKVLVMGSYWKTPKDPEPAIEAFRKIRQEFNDLELWIYGYGPLEPELRKACKSEGMNWLGQLDAEEISECLSRSKGFLMPSQYETFSVGTAEALCTGTPIVVSNAGALPDLVNSQNGILVESPEQWEQCIRQLLSNEWNYRTIASEAAAKYSKEAVGDAYFKIIKSL